MGTARRAHLRADSEAGRRTDRCADPEHVDPCRRPHRRRLLRDHRPGPRTYTASEGVISYCPLDELDRATCAFGELTPALRAEAQARGRQDITVDPAGWPSGPAANREVTISALDDVSGSESYSGWFWNRSHLIADSLGADAVAENLVTGTRTQNVGSTQSSGQYAGGMAFTELIARDYLDSADASGCALYYPPTCGRPVTSVALAGE